MARFEAEVRAGGRGERGRDGAAMRGGCGVRKGPTGRSGVTTRQGPGADCASGLGHTAAHQVFGPERSWTHAGDAGCRCHQGGGGSECLQTRSGKLLSSRGAGAA